MQEVVINTRFGGFGLTHEATIEYAKRKGIKLYAFTGGLGSNYLPYNGEPDVWLVLYFKSDKPVFTDDNHFSESDIPRDDPILVALLKEWGSERTSSKHADLAIVEIPDDADWQVEEYDGSEHIAEKHRTWYADN